jgi:hypothetical protein
LLTTTATISTRSSSLPSSNLSYAYSGGRFRHTSPLRAIAAAQEEVQRRGRESS